MKKMLLTILAGLILFNLISVTAAKAHCEIPCGIYGDKMRFEMLREHIQTIEKSMQEITRLSNEDNEDYNQIVRWVNNKDDHANQLMHIVTQYFMTQRIKPVEDMNSAEYKQYVNKITLLHKMLISAMKSKQTTDLKYVKELRDLVDEFEKAYSGEVKEHKH